MFYRNSCSSCKQCRPSSVLCFVVSDLGLHCLPITLLEVSQLKWELKWTICKTRQNIRTSHSILWILQLTLATLQIKTYMYLCKQCRTRRDVCNKQSDNWPSWSSGIGRMTQEITSCLFVLRFYSPVNNNRAMLSVVSLPNHTFTGKA